MAQFPGEVSTKHRILRTAERFGLVEFSAANMQPKGNRECTPMDAE
jgi:hypothetical protein